MKFLKDAYLSFGRVGDVIRKEEFDQIFQIIDIADERFTRENYMPGSTGQSVLYKELKSKSELWELKFCDLKCEYARWPDSLQDGSKTCRTFIALYCGKLEQLVDKNDICKVDWNPEKAKEK